MTLVEAVEYLKKCCANKAGFVPLSFKGYYCGITNDIERRENEHSADYLGYVNCKTFETAKKLESMMHGAGFDTGAQLGHGQEDSIYVYVYKKTKDTIE